MFFSHVGNVFDEIEKESSRLVMTTLLGQLLSQATPQEAEIICNLSLGQLHPPHIGTQFNVAQKTMVPVVARVLDISEETTKSRMKKEGDLGSIIAQGSWSEKSTMSLMSVYEELCVIEEIEGTGSQELKAAHIEKLCKELDPVSAKYVVRMVIGTLRLGFSDMTIVDALSWVAVGDKSVRSIIEDAYNICADIGLIARVLKESGITQIEKMNIQMGIPIRPAAAERLPTAKAIMEKIGSCIAQPKLDGFRLQIHLDKRGEKPIIHFFSRNLQDMSYMFPDLAKTVTDLAVETLICEGEAICYDPNTGSFLPFQETVKRKRKHGIEEAMTDFPLKLYLFDILYLNGESLLSDTHKKRREMLKKIFGNMDEDNIHIIDQVPIESASELEKYFLENVASGLEGLVIKREDAIYQPGKRNFNWIKLKRQEEGHLEDTIDCVILGYYAGRGKRASFGIGAFLVGVFNKREDRFETVAKIGTGLKDYEWRELKKKCDALARQTTPHNIMCNPALVPDVWVEPEIVCLVRADEITISPVHSAGKTANNLGFALRFPRFMGYRDDKDAAQATESIEIKRLFDNQYARS